jgi:hypothetical protein
MIMFEELPKELREFILLFISVSADDSITKKKFLNFKKAPSGELYELYELRRNSFIISR